LSVLRSEIVKIHNDLHVSVPAFVDSLKPETYNPSYNAPVQNFLNQALDIYRKRYNNAVNMRDKIYNNLVDQMGGEDNFMQFRQRFFNKQLASVVTNEKEIQQYSIHDGEMIPIRDAVYRLPDNKSWRAHFYSPGKYFLGNTMDTFWFDLLFIWVFSIFLFPLLYYDIIRKGLNYMETLRLNRLNNLRLKILVKLTEQNRYMQKKK